MRAHWRRSTIIVLSQYKKRLWCREEICSNLRKNDSESLVVEENHLLVYSEENLDSVHAITQVVLSNVHCLLLDDLLLIVLGLCSVRTEASVRSVVAVARVATLFEKWLVHACRAILFLDDEVGWAAQVSLTGTLNPIGSILLHKLVGVLADILQQLASISILYRPFRHVVVGLFLLQALQNDLVLSRDLHKLSLAGLSVQTFLELQVGQAGNQWDTL